MMHEFNGVIIIKSEQWTDHNIDKDRVGMMLMLFICILSALSVTLAVKNEAIVLNSFAKGEMTTDNFEMKEVPYPTEDELSEGEILLEVHGLSVDPYMRGRLREGGLKNYFVPPFQVGEPLSSGGLGKVIASKNADYSVGDYVGGFFPWQRYFKADPKSINGSKAPPTADVSSYYKFLFNINIAPLSAWLPIRQLWPQESVKPGSVCYVSGAAGGVGQIAGQILKKIYGCYVIGSTGSDEKVKYLKETLGFDEAFNYKKEAPEVALPRLAPNKINYYFDNVGGTTLDATLLHMASHGKIIACGSIENYDTADPSTKMKNLFQIVVNSLTIQGYLIYDFLPYFEVGSKEYLEWVQNGTIISTETYYDGFDKAIDAFIGLFKGTNTGKSIVRVVKEESIRNEL